MKKGDYISLNKDGETLEAKVNWVVDDEAGINYLSPDVYKGSSKVINIKEEAWQVTVSSDPTYQSSVASMSDTELRESINSLRQTRVSLPKATRAKVASISTSPLAQALDKLTPEKKAALMKKLGLID